MKISKTLLPVVAVAALFSGCQDEDFGYKADEIQFKKNFKAAFGNIDPTQDWNFATRACVTVTPGASSNVKIYAKRANDTYKIVGDYSDVTGTQTLGVDVLAGTTDLMICNGSQTQFAQVGGSVDFSGTRVTYTNGTSSSDKIAIVTVDDTYRDFSHAIVEQITASNGLIPEEEDNRDKVIADFSFVSTGQMSFYPIYWQTSSWHILGIYWQDETGAYRTQEIYLDKSPESTEIANKNDDGTYTPITGGGQSTQSGAIFGSKKITLNIPVGTKFGFYIDVYKDGETIFQHSVYSEAEVNRTVGASRYSLSGKGHNSELAGKNANGTNVFGSTFTLNYDNHDYKFFCFEDWNIKTTDLNDLVFMFEEAPVVVDESADRWVLCAEDLSNTFDLDYNDVVVAVSHVSGKKTATVAPLAAGGTLASYVYFGDNCLGEIHELCNGETGKASGSLTPFNVTSTEGTVSPNEMIIEVSERFSLATSTVGQAAQPDANMGGFNIRVVPAGEDATPENATIKGQKIQNEFKAYDVDDKKAENVPYIICLPQTYERTEEVAEGVKHTAGWYRWSFECTPMSSLDGYTKSSYNTEGHSFAEWVADKTKATDWYMYPDVDNSVGTLPTTWITKTLEPTDPTDRFGTPISELCVVGATDCWIPASAFENAIYAELVFQPKDEKYNKMDILITTANEQLWSGQTYMTQFVIPSEKLGSCRDYGVNLHTYSGSLANYDIYLKVKTGEILNPEITLSEEGPLALDVNGTATATITVSSNNSETPILVSSSNTSVATVTTTEVASGTEITITAVKSGNASIIFKQAASASFNSAEKTLNVSVDNSALTAVEITPGCGTEITIETGDVINIAARSTNTDNQNFTYAVTEGTSFVSVSNDGKITGLAVGTATVTIYQEESANFKGGSATVEVTVKAVDKGVLLTELPGVEKDKNVWGASGYYIPASAIEGAKAIKFTLEGSGYKTFMANNAQTTSCADGNENSTTSVPADELADYVANGFYLLFNSGYQNTTVYIKITK